MIHRQSNSNPPAGSDPAFQPVPQAGQPGRPKPVLVRLTHAPGRLWIVEGGDGLFGGAFRDQASALHFAREEASTLGGSPILFTGPAETRRRA
jgi:hypothetical protein